MPENENFVEESLDDAPQHTNDLIVNSEAAFLLKLKVCQNVSDVACQDIIQSVRELCQVRFDECKKVLSDSCKLTSSDFPADVFRSDDMFASIDTVYKQNKYFKEKLSLNMPIPVKLGERFKCKKVKGKRKMVKADVLGYYVPFLKQVESLLSMPEIADVLASSDGNSELVTDVKHGSYVSSHELVKNHPDSLLFDLYYDDYELVNPIGSHRKKHKQAVFYFQLLNIPPEYRGKTENYTAGCMCEICRSEAVWVGKTPV
jgi:hypothetical protein